VELSSEFKREERLEGMLNVIADNYDYILLDCPPSLGLLTINGLVASDKIYVPVEAEYLALKGFSVLEQALGKIGITLDRIFVTKYDQRNILHRDIAQALRQHAGERVFETMIRRNIAIPEATANGLDIFRYDSNCNGAKDYLNLVEEMLSNG
jgi:chromosome partitioning protein